MFLEDGLVVDVYIFNVFIDGFCKSGCIYDVFIFFVDMKCVGCFLDVIVYNMLIDGFWKFSRVEEVG